MTRMQVYVKDRASIKATIVLLAALLSLVPVSSQPWDDPGDILYQVSTIDALLQGTYQGVYPISDLGTHGDFGIGTFDGLDGEMVLLEGIFTQIRADGLAYHVDNDTKVPFATVTFFQPDLTIALSGQYNFTQLCAALDDYLLSSNLFYGIKVHGFFPWVEARAFPRQSEPYQPLGEITSQQSIFQLYDLEGTIVGFYVPAYAKGINVPGYHLHLISDDGSTGGHILDLEIDEPEVILDITPSFQMQLPTSGPFIGVDLSKDLSDVLERVESANKHL